MDNKEIGKRIKKERKKIGLTLKELAEKIGYENYQTLSNIEKGKKTISMKDLYKITKALGLRIDYFFYKNETEKPLFIWRDKKNKKAGKILENKLMEYINNYSLILKLNNMDYPKYKIPSFVEILYNDSKTESEFAERLALEIRTKYLNLGEYPGQELLQSLLDKGIIIFRMNFNNVGSAISTIDRNRAGILINNKDVPWRVTFDIAHELFHLLTWNIYDYEYLQKKRYDEMEKNANIFAINLLIPKQKLMEKISLYHKIDKECIINEAVDFKVSIDTFCNRLIFFNILNESEGEKYKKSNSLKKEFYKLFKFRYKNEDYFVENLEFPLHYFIKALNIYKLGKLSKMQFANLLNKNIAEIDWFLKKELNYE